MKRFHVTVNGKAYDVAVEEIAGGAAPVAAPAAPAPVAAPAAPAPVAAAPAPAPAAPVGGVSSTVEAPMPGTILDIKVEVGQAVAANQVLCILEAMKMENDIITPVAGTVAAIHIQKGDSVNTGTLLVSIA